MMDVKRVLTDFFAAQDFVITVILYGSIAKGTETKKSDVDIAVGGYKKFTPTLLADINLEVSKLVNREIDIVDLNSVNGTILTQILTKGIVLKKIDTALYAELIRKMLYFEEDMAPNLRYIFDYRREKFLNA